MLKKSFVPRSRTPPSEIHFLVDRSVGRYVVPDGLRAVGFAVETLASIYGERGAQAAKDEEWLELAGTESMVVISADSKIRRRVAEIAAVDQFGVKMFCIANANLTGVQQLELVLHHMPRILRESQKDGPWIFSLSASAVMKVWPRI